MKLSKAICRLCINEYADLIDTPDFRWTKFDEENWSKGELCCKLLDDRDVVYITPKERPVIGIEGWWSEWGEILSECPHILDHTMMGQDEIE